MSENEEPGTPSSPKVPEESGAAAATDTPAGDVALIGASDTAAGAAETVENTVQDTQETLETQEAQETLETQETQEKEAASSSCEAKEDEDSSETAGAGTPKAESEENGPGEPNQPVDKSESESPLNSDSESESESGSGSNSDSGSGSGSDSDSDADSIDDTPPKLKYSRISGLPASFFSKDPVSCCLFHDNFFAFATHSGVFHLCKPDYKPIRTSRTHKASILSISTNGEYFATASMDGSVVIGSLSDPADITRYEFKRPVHCVVLDKNYKQSRLFVSGGMAGKVIVSQRNWMGVRSDTVIEQDNGPIVGLEHVDEVIIWANDAGITIYNLMTRTKILNIPRDKDAPRSDLYWPRFHLADADRLLVAWCNYIYTIRISIVPQEQKSFISSAASSFRTPIEHKAELENTLKIDALISGIASFSNELLLVLCYTPPKVSRKGRRTRAGPPEIKLINEYTSEEVADDEVGLKDYELLGLNDYHLGKHTGVGAPNYYIISAKDAAVAQEFNIHDQLTWYIDLKEYNVAWQMCEHIVGPKERAEIGLKQVDKLISEDDWTGAVDFLVKTLYLNTLPSEDSETELDESQQFVAEKWQEYLTKFIESNHIDLISDVVPTHSKLKINHKTYEAILVYQLENNREKYVELVSRWNTKLYDVKHIQSILEEKLEVCLDSSDETADGQRKIRETLSNLYLETNEPNLAVPHLIVLKSPHLLEVMTKYHLLLNFLPRFAEIMSLIVPEEQIVAANDVSLSKKLEPTVDMLIDNKHEVSPDKIIKMLRSLKYDLIAYLFLEKLYQINLDGEFLTNNEDLMIELLAKFNQKKLLYFLVNRNNYNMLKAIDLFKENRLFIKELIFLYGKIGQNKKALKLIVEETNDPDEAIAFIRRQNKDDKELLNILVNFSMDKPIFIRTLIEKAGDLINPIELIKKIPNNTEIENLKSHLIKIILNNDLNILVNENILKIVNRETITNFDIYSKLNERGFIIDSSELSSTDSYLKPLVGFENHGKIHNSESDKTDFKKLFNEIPHDGGELVTETELLGEENVWRNDSLSLKDTIKHLAYIKDKLMQLRGY